MRDEPTLSGVRIREELEKLGYSCGKTILDDLLREPRPRHLKPRSNQRTRYRLGELAQLDLMEPAPGGPGRLRRDPARLPRPFRFEEATASKIPHSGGSTHPPRSPASGTTRPIGP